MNLRFTKFIAISLSFALIVFLGSVAYSITPPRFIIVPPETFELSYDSENGTLYLTTNVSVSNTGFYSIDNLRVGIDIVNSSGYHIIKAESFPLNILAGFSGPIEITLPLNITELLEGLTYDYLFDTLPLNIILSIVADYAFRVFHLEVNYSTQEEWIGPLANLTAKVVDTDISFDNAIKMQSIFQVSHDGWLSLSEIPLNITVDLSNGSELASGFSSFTIVPGIVNNTLSVTMNSRYTSMLLTENATLNLHGGINLYGFLLNFSKPYNWGAPLYGLKTTAPKLIPVNATHSELQTNLSAINYSPVPFGCNATLRIIQSDTILGERISELFFPIGIPTSIPLSLNIINPAIPGSIFLVLELQTPLEVLVYEQSFSI